jgi:hypothetical protein
MVQLDDPLPMYKPFARIKQLEQVAPILAASHVATVPRYQSAADGQPHHAARYWLMVDSRKPGAVDPLKP